MTRMLALLIVCGCSADNSLSTNNSDGGEDGGGEDLAMAMSEDLAQVSLPDLAKLGGPVDLAGSDFGGVMCGNQTCGSSQICCLQQGSGAMCVALGGCPDGGAAATCDGPEDCMAGTPSCCANVKISMGGANAGNAMCTATCTGMASFAGGLTVTTKLCHSDADCAGYTGMFNNMSSAWDACCHQMMGGPHFCANSGFAGFGGYTCP